MTKQELIDELKKLLAIPSEIQGHNYGLRRAIALAKQLDEPEKTKVPQFIAEWYEEHKDNFVTVFIMPIKCKWIVNDFWKHQQFWVLTLLCYNMYRDKKVGEQHERIHNQRI